MIRAVAGIVTVGMLLGFGTPSRVEAQTGSSSEPTWEQIVEAAKREGSLKVAGHPSDVRRAAFMAFQEAYPGIKIEYVSIGSHGQADARLKAEWDAKVFDWDILASGQQFIYSEMVPSGALIPIRDIIIKSENKDDRAWQGGFDAGFLDRGRKYVFGFMIYIAEIAYVDTRAHPLNAFKSVNDLLDPKYRGKIAWADSRAGGVADIMTGFLYQRLGADGFRSFFTTQNPHVVGTSRQLLDAMLRAGKPIGIGVTTGTLRNMRDAGLGDSIQRIDFPDGRQVGRSGGFIAVPKSAPHPNAAKVFANWLLSRDGQTSWVKLSQENSARVDVPVADPLRYPDPKLDWFTWDNEEAEFLEKYQLPARKIVTDILGTRK
jgi:iron(III) transport system substrate-binding protein